MPASRDDNYGELMSFLLRLGERFETDEDFNQFAVAEVRHFITDLRALGIELTLRPNYGGQPVTHNSVTQKLTQSS